MSLCSFVQKMGVNTLEGAAEENTQPFDPLFVSLWGDAYLKHPEYERDVLEPLKSGRALPSIKADLEERLRNLRKMAEEAPSPYMHEGW